MLSALCLYLFMVHMFTASNPFVEPALFRDRNFVAGLIFNFFASSTMMATMAPARIAGPLLIGAAIDRWSYTPSLLVCVVCALGSLLAMQYRPRGIR